MALLVYVHDQPGKPPRTLAFERSPVRIGRNPLNDVTIDHAFVSQWHAQFRFEANEVTMMDLGSTNGSAINGQRLKSQENVRVGGPNDEIQLGPIRLRLNFGSGALAGDQGTRMSVPGRSLKGGATMMISAGDGRDTAEYLAPSQLVAAETLKRSAAAFEAIRPAFAQYRQAWAGVLHQVKLQIHNAPEPIRPMLLRAILRDMPQLAAEPELATLLSGYQMDTAEFMLPEPRAWLSKLAGSPESMKNDVNVGRAMDRVAALLEAFSESYVELRKGMESFGGDIGLQLASTDSMLHKAQSRADVMAYLLDWRGDGEQRVEDLRRSFVDVAMHQVSMLSGVMAGTRALLDEVSPDNLESGKGATALAVKQPLWARLLRFGSGAKWERLRTAHRALVENDRFSRLLFGREFARAYYAVSGKKTDGRP